VTNPLGNPRAHLRLVGEDVNRRLDRRLGLAAAILLAAVEGKQN
jgi:hypothetical protein